MLITDVIRSFLQDNNLMQGYMIQPYIWNEREDTTDAKYLVIQPQSNGDADSEFVDDNVRIILIGPVGYNKLALNRDAETLNKAFIDSPQYDDVYSFSSTTRPMFMETKEDRPVFELNILCESAI